VNGKEESPLATCGLRDAAKARSISKWSFRAKRLANWKQDSPGIHNRRVFLSNKFGPGGCRYAHTIGVHIFGRQLRDKAARPEQESNEYRVVRTARKPKRVVTNDRILTQTDFE
jgi:hypothetical protein